MYPRIWELRRVAHSCETHATDSGEDNTVLPCVVGGRSTVGSFSNYSEWDRSACTDGGHDKDDFLGDAGEYRSVSLARLAKFIIIIIIIWSPYILFCIFTNSGPL